VLGVGYGADTAGDLSKRVVGHGIGNNNDGVKKGGINVEKEMLEKMVNRLEHSALNRLVESSNPVKPADFL
jgi:hypothetical protein